MCVYKPRLLLILKAFGCGFYLRAPSIRERLLFLNSIYISRLPIKRPFQNGAYYFFSLNNKEIIRKKLKFSIYNKFDPIEMRRRDVNVPLFDRNATLHFNCGFYLRAACISNIFLVGAASILERLLLESGF